MKNYDVECMYVYVKGIILCMEGNLIKIHDYEELCASGMFKL